MRRLSTHLRRIFFVTVVVGSSMTIVGHASSAPNDAVFFLPMDGNATDASGNGHNGTIHNITFRPRTPGDEDLVAVMNGQLDQWIEVPDAPSLNPDGVTLSVWCYNQRTNNSDVRFLCGKAYESLEIHFGGAPFQPEKGVRFIPGNGAIIDTLGESPAQQWFHLVCVAGPGSGDGKIFINGVPVAVTNTGSPATNLIAHVPGRFAIGMRGGDPGWGHFDGQIAAFRFFGRALSDDEVKELYTYELGPRIKMVKAIRPRFTSLKAGTTYQLQIADRLNVWTNEGVPFVATNGAQVYPKYWDVDDWNRLFFRLNVAE